MAQTVTHQTLNQTNVVRIWDVTFFFVTSILVLRFVNTGRQKKNAPARVFFLYIKYVILGTQSKAHALHLPRLIHGMLNFNMFVTILDNNI